MHQRDDNVRLLIFIVIINDMRLHSKILPRKLQGIIRIYPYINALGVGM
jgi:hypothetical protein